MGPIIVKAAGLALMIFSGWGLRRLGVFRQEDSRVLSRVIVNLTLPAALIGSFRTFRFDASFLALILIAAASNLLLFFAGQGLSRKRDPTAQALYALNASSYNIGCFVLPFAQSFLPAEALIGVSMFDAGNCPFNSGLSYALIAPRINGERTQPSFVLGRLVRSVPFMTYLVLMLLSVLEITLPDFMYQTAATVGGANTFLAMLMIGILFDFRVEQEDRRQLTEILALRYGGSFILCLLVWFLPLPLLVRQVAVLSMLAPIPSVTMVYCEKCGCKGESYGPAQLAYYVGYEPDLFFAPAEGDHPDGYYRQSERLAEDAKHDGLSKEKCPHKWSIPLYDSEGNVIGKYNLSCNGHYEGMTLEEIKKAVERGDWD